MRQIYNKIQLIIFILISSLKIFISKIKNFYMRQNFSFFINKFILSRYFWQVSVNPIEHIWNEVEQRLRDLRGHINSKEDLWESCRMCRNGIEVDVCRKLIATIPQRIQDVLKAKGGYTRWQRKFYSTKMKFFSFG